MKLAEEYKTEGNKLTELHKFADALDKYSDAINLNIETAKNAIYYSNRANVHLKMENFGLAIAGKLNSFFIIIFRFR